MAATTVSRPRTHATDSESDVTTILLNRLITLFNNGVYPQGVVLPVLALSTNTFAAKTTNTTAYAVDGVLKVKAATDNLWTATGGVLAISSFRKYLCLLDASGTASVYASSDSTVSAAACQWNLGPGALPWDGKAIIGYYSVATDASHTFTPGAALNGAGITTTFFDGRDATIIPVIVDAQWGTICGSGGY